MFTEVRQAAKHDALTGLPNRILLAELLAERTGPAVAAVALPTASAVPAVSTAAAGSRPAGPAGSGGGSGTGCDAPRVGLCFLDLDGFRQVNAILGFGAGDRLLAAVAARLAGCAQPAGHTVARTGGDEFAVLLAPGADFGAAGRFAERLLAVLREPVAVDGRDLTVTASIGAVDAPAAGADPEDLMRAADLALHWAKGEGRDRWTLFDPDRAVLDIARYRLAADLPAAVENGEFFCEYQPIVDLADGTVSSVEALVRWRHPRFGLVGPDRFITLAEDSGLIVELGRRVLAEACAQAATWPSVPGRPAPAVSVNVAVRQTRDPRLTAHVLAALDAAGLPADRLRLEITESALLPGDDTAARVLAALAARGVRIAVDDFGTGYSNLAHLRRLPVHILKIDGTFVAGLDRPGDPANPDEQIVGTVTALGHALGLSVTAEGVETAAQLAAIRRLGCDTGQGWLFSRALPADGIRELLVRGARLAASHTAGDSTPGSAGDSAPGSARDQDPKVTSTGLL